MECVIFVGAQATGKSSFYKERFFRTHVRINLDMLRTRHREKKVVETCLETGQPFVIDNTNPSQKDRQRYIVPAKEHGFKIIGYYFQSKLEDVLQRNASRDTDEQIPEKGVRGTHAALQIPSIEEGFDVLYYVWLDEKAGFVVDGWKNEI